MEKTVRTLQLPSLSGRIQAELDWAVELSNWLGDNLTEHFEVASQGQRGRARLAFAHIALEHREAFFVLVAVDARSSLGTILRSMVDASLRAIWCGVAAQEDVVKRLVDGDHHVTARGMLADLKKRGKTYTEGVQKVYSTLSDYAHSEELQLSRWMSSDQIGPGHLDAEVIELMGLANQVGMISALEREEVAGGQRTTLFIEKALEVHERNLANVAQSLAAANKA